VSVTRNDALILRREPATCATDELVPVGSIERLRGYPQILATAVKSDPVPVIDMRGRRDPKHIVVKVAKVPANHTSRVSAPSSRIYEVPRVLVQLVEDVFVNERDLLSREL
jgi:hypothetical protein